jgi:hypothetical protein
MGVVRKRYFISGRPKEKASKTWSSQKEGEKSESRSGKESTEC